MSSSPVQLISLTLFIATCAGAVAACGAETVVDFHVIEPPEEAVPQVKAVCRYDAHRRFAYQFPAGVSRELVASELPVLSVAIGKDDVVRLMKIPPVNSASTSVVSATVIPPHSVAEHAAARRLELQWCDLLVVVAGTPVGISYGGTGPWGEGVPAGTYRSYEAAEATLAGGGHFERTVAPDDVMTRDAAFSDWLGRRDAWEFHCHPESQESVRVIDPDAYERLKKLAKPDCETLPMPPD